VANAFKGAPGVDLVARAQKLGRGEDVAHLRPGRLDLARLAAAFAVGAVVEGERRESFGGELLRVAVGHLLADAGPRAGADDTG